MLPRGLANYTARPSGLVSAPAERHIGEGEKAQCEQRYDGRVCREMDVSMKQMERNAQIHEAIRTLSGSHLHRPKKCTNTHLVKTPHEVLSR